MAVKGKSYPYIGPGRELFHAGPSGAWYIPKALAGSLAFGDLSGPGGTPDWTVPPTDLFVNWTTLSAGIKMVNVPPIFPFGSASQELTIDLIRKKTVDEQIVSVAFLSIVPTGGPFADVHVWQSIFELRPQDYPGWFNLYPATYKIDNVDQGGNWFLNFNVIAVGWP